MEKCCVCDQEKDESEGRKYTPRELVDNFLVEPGTTKDMQMRLAAMASFAASIIQFDNPPGGADEPMNWICTACQKRFFSKATTGKKYAKEGRLNVYDFETGTSSTKPKSGCFVATACYGSAECPEVQCLRTFRDTVLLTRPLGQSLVRFYYIVSPSIAHSLQARPQIADFIRRHVLDRLVRLANKINARRPDKADARDA